MFLGRPQRPVKDMVLGELGAQTTIQQGCFEVEVLTSSVGNLGMNPGIPLKEAARNSL